MPRKTKAEKSIEEANYLLAQIVEDTGIPRNIRRAANNAVKTLKTGEGTLAIRASTAISLLDDISQDPNCPLHARTRIYQVLSRLETIRD